MADETRSEKYDRQTKEQFEALGRFVQAYEMMIDHVRSVAKFCVQNPQNSGMVSLIFNHSCMTAKPLWELCHAFMRQKIRRGGYSEADAALSILAQFNKEFADLTKLRNGMLHGTWYIGAASSKQEDFSDLHVHKFEVSKDGLTPRHLPKSAGELLALVDRCDEAGNLLLILHGCVGAGLSIAGNFIQNSEGWWDRPQELKPPKRKPGDDLG